MIEAFIFVGVILLVVLFFKLKIAKNKDPQKRGPLEKVLVSMFVSGRRELEEAADQIRTPEISREECLQRVKKAIQDLETDFNTQMKQIIYHESKLREDILPKLKEKPGYYEGKARIFKQRMLKESSQEAQEAQKQTAITFLDLKKKALNRIKEVETHLQNTESVKAKALATYEGQKATLEDIHIELETTMASNISTARFNQSMDLIKALRRETADKLRQQNAEIEAREYIDNSNSNTSTIVNSSEFEDELAAL